MNDHRPLCVDLDGTLIATDTLWESIALLARRVPSKLVAMPFWLAKGRAYFKRQLNQHVVPDPKLLPYHQELLTHLRGEAETGRPLILATGSDERVAQPIAEHLGIFDHVIASDGTINCTGRAKVESIRRKLGQDSFDYIGNSKTDRAVWSAAAEVLVVASDDRDAQKLVGAKPPQHVFRTKVDQPLDIIGAMRISQWSKNLLLVVPMLVGHQLGPQLLAAHLQHLLVAFFSFGVCASGVYLINDLLDLESDRRHWRKRFRPLAAGRVRLPTAVITALLLLAGGLLTGMLLGGAFVAMLAIYLLITTMYSLRIKRMLILDVIVLAGLYTHRIVAGGVAIGVLPSPWLLAFSMFLFLSLAFVKRYSELLLTDGDLGRSYRPEDIDLIRTVGPTSGYIAVLVFCLYINSDIVPAIYSQPQILWAICPVLLYWITRIWFVAQRKQLVDDPVVFTLRDPASYLAGVSILIILLGAKFL